MKTPDFYLSSSEHADWSCARKCFVLRHISGPRQSGYWLVRVDPPLPDTGAPDLTEIVVAERGFCDDLAQLGRQPMPVYVCRIRNRAAVDTGQITEADIEVMGWAEVSRASGAS
jgi:hypothetical protein